MFSLVQKRRWFFLFSAAVIIPGILIMLYSLATTGAPLRLSVDFEGGSIYELQFLADGANEANIREVFTQFGNDNPLIQRLGDASQNRWSVRANFQDQATSDAIVDSLEGIAPVDREGLRSGVYRGDCCNGGGHGLYHDCVPTSA
jgi:preprotein translocase subunit SecF